MKALPRFALGLAFLFAAGSAAYAQRVELKGVGSAPYDAKQNAPADAEARAAREAKLAAWRAYVAAQSTARQQAIAAHEADFIANLDKLIVDTVVVASQQDAGTLKVVLRVGFNDESVNQMVSKLTVGNGEQGRSQDSSFSFLFMARKATSITQFDARRTAVRQAEAVNAGADDGGVTATRTMVSGGSSQQKADTVTYEVGSSQDVDAAMSEVLTTSGIEYVDYNDIVSNCHGVAPKRFQAEFVQADELSPQTRADVIRAARECEVRYFATGTIDTEVAQTDPVSGNQKVYVSVRTQLWDISKKLPRKIGSVGPKQYSGLGPNQNVAGRNALALAARDVIRNLVDQLNAKGIR
ncbi:MAG: hypothetical protein ACXWC4_22495 [Telluria sp.]